jgi:hypothetical protein
MASGSWIYFLGADDFFADSHTLQAISEGITAKKGCQLFYGDVWFEDLNRKYDGPFTPEKLLNRNICHQALFYSRHLFELRGLYDLRFRIEADYVYNLGIFLDGKISTCYLPVLVATFSSGGVSHTTKDPVFKNEYGRIVFAFLFKSNYPMLKKLKLMAVALANIRYRTFLQ